MLALLVAAIAFLRRRIDWGTGWVWPVPNLLTKDGTLYLPVISDGVGSPRGAGIHRGVDIFYRRKTSTDRPEYKAGTSDGTPLFFNPPLVPVLAARDGVIWSAGNTPRGWSVVIDHGKPFATYYTHLAALAVAPHARGRNALTGQPTRVKAGDVIGVMGFDPMDARKLRHLHFSVAHDGPPETAAVDPAPEMTSWPRVSKPFEV